MNDWNEKLEYSLASQQRFDIAMLKHHIPGCIDIRKTDLEEDRKGVDYIATLRNGAEIKVDAKTRAPGSKRWWRNGEAELALEVWSVVEPKKIGWTLNEASDVDYILYTFDPFEWPKYYFLPFQLLRIAFFKNGRAWLRRYGTKRQQSNSWQSECMFVPASVVVSAITDLMNGDMQAAVQGGGVGS